MKNKFFAFTIIELLVVVMVIGILASVVVVSYGGLTKKAYDNSLQSNIDKMADAQEIYSAKNLSVAGKAYFYSGTGDGYDADLDFRPSEGTVIDVVVNGDGYCIRSFNPKSSNSSIFNALEKESSEGMCDLLQPSEIVLAESNGKAYVSSNYYSTCAISFSGQAYCWGYNAQGQIGDGTTDNRLIPTPVDTSGVLSGKTIKQIEPGYHHTCAIASDNQAYCWGNNTSGALGNNSTTNSSVPVAVYTAGVLSGKTIKDITTGEYHTCAIASDDSAYCWGQGQWGQLGNNSTTNSSVPVAVYTAGVLSGKTIKDIESHYQHNCAIASDNKAYCWGSSLGGALGNNSDTSSSVPVAVYTAGVLSGKTIKQVKPGDYHTCAIASDNQAYCWGRGTSGGLGNNSTTNSLIPVAVYTAGVLSGKTIKFIATGYYHACVIASDNKAYCWGLNTYGKVGDNSTTTRLIPVAVYTAGVLSSKTITSITTGYSFSCVTASDGQAYCWGAGSALGYDSLTNSSIPVLVSPNP